MPVAQHSNRLGEQLSVTLPTSNGSRAHLPVPAPPPADPMLVGFLTSILNDFSSKAFFFLERGVQGFPFDGDRAAGDVHEGIESHDRKPPKVVNNELSAERPVSVE
jgi:hypothetical protein